MAGVELRSIRKTYADLVAVDDVSIAIREGELLALLGPSGCGKTTTLRAIAGFVQLTSGQVLFGERDVTALPVHKRNVGMVFQGYALFPHLDVSENVRFGLRVRKWDKARVAERVSKMLAWVQLEKLAHRRPRELSGGQQQRVALARAMAIDPDVLLLDEPFSALDAKLRQQMRTEIRQLQREAGITSVFVTHDQEEAMAIADRIGVMNHGKLEQLGSAEDLYKRPTSRFVAGFIGKCNFIEGRVTAPNEFESRDGTRHAFVGAHGAGPAALCVRPEHLTLSTADRAQGNRILVTLRNATYLGPATEFELVTPAGDNLLVSASSVGSGVPREGTPLAVSWRPEDAFVVN
jgi:putative spermidine/putrescine transport system ATP-binding protein